MNFLLRTSQPIAPEPSVVAERDTKEDKDHFHSHQGSVLEHTPIESLSEKDGKIGDGEGINLGGAGNGSLNSEVSRAKTRMVIEDHSDVAVEEGGILIPSRELPENWQDVPDLNSIKQLDRDFVFPGEQLHILVYVSASDRESREFITPFKVAAVMSKKSNSQKSSDVGSSSETSSGDINTQNLDVENSNTDSKESLEDAFVSSTEKKTDVHYSESFLKMEDHKKRVSVLLEGFRNSHFFVRIAGADQPLWAKTDIGKQLADSSSISDDKDTRDKCQTVVLESSKSLAAVIEGGKFDPCLAGGVARNAVTCSSLSNGDVVVVLQVTVATDITEDAVLEVLQFEKYETISSSPLNNPGDRLFPMKYDANKDSHDPCKDLLQWLLPLDRPIQPAAPSVSPPSLSSVSFSASSPQRPSVSGSSSNLFSFGNFRSYSSNSLPAIPLTPSAAPNSASPNLNLEDWDCSQSQKSSKAHEVGSEGLLSFRGASLEPQRFSVHCGLEGLYIPGKRWRRKLNIVQAVEVDCYFSECNTEDLICVLIKNVVPANIPDVVFFVDSISLICDIAAQGCPPVSIPIICIEAGDDHSLPGLALRRGEQHSFILRPATSAHKVSVNNSSFSGSTGYTTNIPKKDKNLKRIDVKSSNTVKDHLKKNQFAVLVSCRCSHTESRIFFKHATQWQPRAPRDLLISVESEIAKQAVGSESSISELPAQFLTLQATNLTSSDLNLTLLAPASAVIPQSVVSMTSTPSTPCVTDKLPPAYESLVKSHPPLFPSVRPMSTVAGVLPSDSEVQNMSVADIMADSNSACTHLWLQSAVPLGCVPSLSTKTVRLELLPLRDGIITLDTLHIACKEKVVVYVPEKSLKIYSTSSIISGII